MDYLGCFGNMCSLLSCYVDFKNAVEKLCPCICRSKELEPPLIHEEKKNNFFGRTVVELTTIEENISQYYYMTKHEPSDMKLYNDIKAKVWKMYDKPSAYRSGMLVKLYPESGGRYSGDKD